jgi:2,3-diketo-5-methylthio-1-phosphopentane phosphatase
MAAEAAAGSAPLPPPPPALVVFDFDCSLIDVNSDEWVPAQLAPPLLAHIAEHKRGVQWTALMADVAVRMHAAGVTRAAVEACLAAMPVAEEVVAVIRAAAAASIPVHIVSDANAVYISAFLAGRGLAPAVAGVVTNRAEWDAHGCLRIAPHHEGPAPHGCPRCPVNLCKGGVMDRLGFSARAGGDAATATATATATARRPPLVYIGDGGGDLCPALRLGPGDLILARAGYPLHARLTSPAIAPLVAARVQAWADGRGMAAAIAEFIAAAGGAGGRGE